VRLTAAVALLAGVLVTGAGVRHAIHISRAPALLTEGIAADPCAPQNVIIVPAHRNVRYDNAESSVLVTGSGPAASGDGPAAASGCTPATEPANRGWLAAGSVPGMNHRTRSMAQRALLDLHLSTRPDGAVVAGWYPGWDYAWPRDSSWVAVALAVTGHGADARRVLTFLRQEQSRDGTWAARYQPDGGGAVRDGRPAELDAVGWVPWAVWSWYEASHPARAELAALWPMVSAAAGAAERSLSPGGLPAASTDYWEHGTQVTLGTAAPLLTGLRAAAGIAGTLGRTQAAQRWADDAARLARAIGASFGCYGFNRLPDDSSGPDASVTFLGPPFGPGSAALERAEDAAERALTLPGGGVRPGADWPGNTETAWTAETAFFALFDASTGENGRAAALLSWLAAHRTPLGALPEQVTAAGQPASVAPLAWTDAAVLIALAAPAHPLPVPPVPAGGQPPAAGGCLLPPLTVVGR
jgi:glucoamylase